MSIKLLVISKYNDYHSSRPEAKIFIELAKKSEFEIHIMTFGETKFREEFEQAGIKLIDFHPKKKFDKEEIEFIRNYLIENSIEILHLFNSQSSYSGIRAAKNLDVKVVLYRGFAGHINWYNPISYLKYLHPRVDKIVCNSIGVENYLKKHLLWRKNKAISANKGHDINWYNHYKTHNIKEELGLNQDSFLLINVANNRKMKGIPYLLKAISLLKSNKNIHLLLVGNGMDTKENLKFIESSGISDKVHILGFREDVLNIVAASDVFVLSSIFGESITKSVIEAMSIGIAPIITDIPGNLELVEDGKSGLVVKSKSAEALKDAILKLYNNKELLNKISQEASKHIENKLNTKNTVQAYGEIYKDLVTS
jgi:glycosyltransferase involved in cell wall biosynthesis